MKSSLRSEIYSFVDSTRPMILVRFLSPSDSGIYCDTQAIVDTGAELSLLGSEMPSRIGRDLFADSKKTIGNQGIGGNDVAYLHEFIIQVMTPGFKDVFWESDILQIGCSGNLKGKPALLGIKGVLEHFEIHIDFKNSSITLTKQEY